VASVVHLGPGYTEGVDYTRASAASASSLAGNKPTGVTDNITLRAFAYSQVSAGATMTPPSGWTLDTGITARRGGFYYKKIPSASAETATSYTWSAASAGRMDVIIWIVENEGATPLDVAGTWTTEATTATASSISPANAGDILYQLTYWNNSSTTQSTVNVASGFTDGAQISSPATGNTSGISVSFKQLSASGATGTAAQTATPTPTNMSSILVAITSGAPAANANFGGAGTFNATVVQNYPSVAAPFSGSGTFSTTVTGIYGASFSGSGTFSATVTNQTASANAAFSGSGTFKTQTPLDKWLANTPLYVAHRGGSADWPEMTMYAYAKAAQWNPNIALEVSVIRTADGYWMASHDQTTTRVFGVTYDIPSTNWIGTLQNLRTTNGNQPPCLLTDVLAAYPNRIIFVDDKMNSWLPQFLDTLDAYGGANRIVVKGYGPQAGDITKAQAAIARGYQTWGYYYHADTANIASTQSNWSILGEDAVGSPPGDATDWAAIKSYNKPVLAHIIATAGQKSYADTFSPTGYMASGVMEVVPPGSTIADFGGTGTMSATVSVNVPVTAGFSGSGAFTASATQTYAVTAGFSGSGSFTAIASASGSVNATFGGSGSFSAVVTQSYAVASGFSGSGTFQPTISQTYSVSVVFGGTGSFAVAVSGGDTPPYTGPVAVFVWNGTSLIPAFIGLWDGTSIQSVDFTEIV
jgi:hypothetical protein